MLSSLLSFSKLYGYFSRFILRHGAIDFLFKHKPGTKILDVGCGPGSHTHYFIDSNYLGLDLSAKYIQSANERYKQYDNINFLQADVNAFFSTESEELGKFDLIILCGVLHHLDDGEIDKMLWRLSALLNTDGELRTFDGVYTEDQPILAKYALDNDRGKFIRTAAAYERLITKHLPDATYIIYDNLLRIPYTHIVFNYTRR